MDATDFIKKQLSSFIQESLNENKKIDLKDGSETNINKAIYEIQNHFTNELLKHNINTQLNPLIISPAILNSFKNSNPPAHPAKYYAYPFLKFICLNFRPKTELFEYIDLFLDKHKQQLSWNDLVITNTGATRCKTNIRFSLDYLREYMLIRNKNKEDKRTVYPTVLGHLVVLFIQYLQDTDKPNCIADEEISQNRYFEFYCQLNRLNEPLMMKTFLEYIAKTQALNKEDKEKVERYLTLFTYIILNNLDITDNSIKFNNKIKDEKEYLQLLNEMSAEYITFNFNHIK